MQCILAGTQSSSAPSHSSPRCVRMVSVVEKASCGEPPVPYRARADGPPCRKGWIPQGLDVSPADSAGTSLRRRHSACRTVDRAEL